MIHGEYSKFENKTELQESIGTYVYDTLLTYRKHEGTPVIFPKPDLS